MARVKVKRKCSNCGVPGHQKRTCKKPVAMGSGSTTHFGKVKLAVEATPNNGHSETIRFLQDRAAELHGEWSAVSRVLAMVMAEAKRPEYKVTSSEWVSMKKT